MGIYQTFYSQYLHRVQNALKGMGQPAVACVEDSIDDVEASSQDIHDNASSSQGTAFKLPHAPASKKQKGELASLRDHIFFSSLKSSRFLFVRLMVAIRC